MASDSGRNHLVPMPQAASVDALNAKLFDGCRARLGARLRGQGDHSRRFMREQTADPKLSMY
jgi:hypothetical protein